MRIAFFLPLTLMIACTPPGQDRPDPRSLSAHVSPRAGCGVPTLAGGEAGIGYAGIPAAQSALLGRWVDGVWDDTGACHALTIEQIATDGSVTATFATGASAVAPPTARRVTGHVDTEGVLELELPDGSRAIYALDGAILRGAHFRNEVMRPVALSRG